MSFSTTWDINKYKSEFESEEHWELRTKFMETHKNRFPEEKLVCLARVFFNIEFLGCRYPQETMELIAELSKGVADEHREKQKNKLKRTFVAASDAAGDKIKRSSGSAEPPAKKGRTDSPSTTGFQRQCFVHEGLDQSQNLLTQGEFPGLVIFHNCSNEGQMERCPINILTMSSQKCQGWHPIDFVVSTRPDQTKHCEVFLNKKLLASGSGANQKEAKVAAATNGLNLLRQSCYTIQAKCKYFSGEEMVVTKAELPPQPKVDTPLPMDNIGCRMMQRMGWTGSGLGKNKQGIQTHVQAAPKMIQRSGFGRGGIENMKRQFRNTFLEFLKNDSDNDLVFSSDFDNNERKELHHLASSLGLKTRSYGKNNQRHLVVFKNLTVKQIVKYLLSCGGENAKYLLIPPQPQPESKQNDSTDLVNNQPTNSIIKEKHIEPTIKEKPSHGAATCTTDIVMKELSEIVKKEPSNVNIKKEGSSDILINENPSKIVIKEESTDIVIKEEISNIKVKSESSDISSKEETCDIEENVPGILRKENIPIKQPHLDENGLSTLGMNDDITGIVVQEYLKMSFPYPDVDPEASIVTEFLSDRNQRVKEALGRYDKIIKIFREHKFLTKKERRVYNGCIKELQEVIGCTVDNIFQRSPKVDKKGSPGALSKHVSKQSDNRISKRNKLVVKHNYENIGADIVKKYPVLNCAIYQEVRRKYNQTDLNLIVRKKKLRHVKTELHIIGKMYTNKCNGGNITTEKIVQSCSITQQFCDKQIAKMQNKVKVEKSKQENKQANQQNKKKQKKKIARKEKKANKCSPGNTNKTASVRKRKKLNFIRFKKATTEIF